MVPSDWQYHRDEAIAATKVGGLTRAEQSWLMALSIAQSMDDSDPRVAYTLDNLASTCFAQGKYAEAEVHCRSAYEAIERAYGKEHISRVNCLNNLAGIYYCLKRFSLAEQLCVQVLTMFNKALGPEHEYIGLARQQSGHGLSRSSYKFPLAQMMYERALPIRQAALGASDPVVLTMLHNYANVLDELGHVEKSNQIRSELDTNRVWQLFGHDSQEKLSA